MIEMKMLYLKNLFSLIVFNPPELTQSNTCNLFI